MKTRKYYAGLLARLLLITQISACAGSLPEPPYPAFIQVDELPDIFVAGLPGVRAKQLAGNPQTRRSSIQISLPADWQFTTGAAPGLSVEIYVIAGSITLGGLAMSTGAYAYVPPASTGMQMSTNDGAVILYFLDDANEQAVIQMPLITNSNLLDWQPLSDDLQDIGLASKELRADPGSGARTWLLKVDPIAMQKFRTSNVTNEGYLLHGSYQTSECVLGEVVTDTYTKGGYFHRTPGAVHGGSEEAAPETAIWFMRVLQDEATTTMDACVAPSPTDGAGY
jgi:hypothetical protein